MDAVTLRRAWARFKRWMARPRSRSVRAASALVSAKVLHERSVFPRLSMGPKDSELAEICAELAELEQRALRQLAEAQENLDKVRAMQKKAGCPRTPVH